MRVRYKSHPDQIRDTTKFNLCGLSEIDMYDDSASIKDLDIEIPGIGWKDMSQAFVDGDIVVNNLNTHFGLPINAEAKQRGFNP